MNTIELYNGVEIPCISYGTWKLPTGDGCIQSVCNAVDAGYRSIDAAYSYGNDFYVGKAVKQCGLSRDKLFISNKLWKTFYGKENTITACKKSLKLMKLDYFDLYLIHWPVSADCDDWEEMNYSTWCGMGCLYKEGLVRAIGVSNFYANHLTSLHKMNPEIEPMVNQIEFHPGFYDLDTYNYCKSHNIVMQGWSPLGSGKLIEHPQVISLAKKYNRTASQICLRYVVQKGVIPVSRTTKFARAIENKNLFDFSISDDEMGLLENIQPSFYSGWNPDSNQP